MIKFTDVGTFSNAELFRVTFNTAFIAKTNIMACSRVEISPENLHKNTSKFGDNFQVILEFEDFCRGEVDIKTNQLIR